jgi:hypothetical protein
MRQNLNTFGQGRTNKFGGVSKIGAYLFNEFEAYRHSVLLVMT